MEKRNKKIIILLSGALLMILLITAIINITKIKEMFVEKKQAADISKLISVNGTYKDGVSKDGEREVQFEYSDKMLLSGAGSGVNGRSGKSICSPGICSLFGDKCYICFEAYGV